MSWREDANFGIVRADKLFLGSGLGVQFKHPASVVTAATPASGTCAVQFTFKDGLGNAMDVPIAGFFYMSEVSTGLSHDPADTSIAVLTNGAVTTVDAANKVWMYTTTAAGLLGITITAAADDYYIVFMLPSGQLLISDVCTVNA